MKAISQELACALAHAAAVGDGCLPPVEGLTFFVDRHSEPVRSLLSTVPDLADAGAELASTYPPGFDPATTQAVPVKWALAEGGAVLVIDYPRVVEQLARAPRLPLTGDTRVDVAGLADLFDAVTSAVERLERPLTVERTVAGLADAVRWLARRAEVLDAMVSRGER